MDYFGYRDGTLFAEDVPVPDIVKKVGTPVYIYSTRTFLEHYRKVVDAFAEVDPLICYSVKANGNLSVLKKLADAGAGFDVVSGGEILRVLRAGGDPARITFAGVAKTDQEINEALDAGIFLFDVESEDELKNIARLARKKNTTAAVALRVNPDVDPHTHKYITTGKSENKFGVDMHRARHIITSHYQDEGIDIVGLHMHIGSQITDIEPYEQAIGKVIGFAQDLTFDEIKIKTLNLGGGFGIFYRGDEAKDIGAFAKVIIPAVKKLDVKLVLEPGRFIMGNAGILVSRVQYVKSTGAKNFALMDAGMNALIRPSLYGAYHKIWPVKAAFTSPEKGAVIPVDVAGPICESADVFAIERELPPQKRGDLIAVFSAGAYAFSMSSNYNAHPRPAEVLVEGGEFTVVRKRETYEDLVRGEKEPLSGGKPAGTSAPKKSGAKRKGKSKAAKSKSKPDSDSPEKKQDEEQPDVEADVGSDR
ncbi:MAG: diaminopimelate decarboxylase [Planctomycetota bacterium]|nr:MAG: diaminopimelate decarboxylase [Planctomycetota bacterium]